MCGTNWHTRYFSVRAHRLNEEYLKGRAVLEHCSTKEMLAETLTKLATTPVIQVLLDAMDGIHNINHQTSVSPGPQNPSDKAGDGPLARQPRHKIRYQYPQGPKTPVIKQVMDLQISKLQHCGEVVFSSVVQVAIQNRKAIYAPGTHYISYCVSCCHIVCYSMLLDLQHLWLTVVPLATCGLDTTTGGIYIQLCYQG